MPAPANPFDDGRTWYYNENTGQIQHIKNWLEQQYFNGLSYEIRFNTRAEAEAYKAQHPPSHKSIFDPTNPNNPIHVPAPPHLDISGFLSALANANTWVRVAEVLIGVVLIAVGIAELTNAVPAATKIARVVK